MDFEKRLRENINAVVLTCLVAAGLIIWAGVAIYHHDHNKTPVPSTDNSSNPYAATTGPGGSTGGSGTTQADTSGNGLDANGCYTPTTVRQHENITGCVDFNVGYAYQDSAGTVFIDQLSDYTEGVQVYIPWNAPASDIDYQALEGKNIKATGYISDYNGSPQVTVNELSQIGIYNN